MSQKYDAYLKTDYWKAVTNAVKKRAGYRCQVCNSQHDLQAHHRTYEHRGHELDYLDDLICLCRRCHGVFHGTISALSKPVNPVKPKTHTKGAIHIVPHTPIDAEVPDSDPILLTEELVNRCRTQSLAFTNATIRAFGLTRPLQTGWPFRLRGTSIARESYRSALEGRFIYNSGPLR